MKKIYAAAALAVTIGFSASAVTVQGTKSVSDARIQKASPAIEAVQAASYSSNMAKAPATPPTLDELINGLYVFQAYNSASNNGGWMSELGNPSVKITKGTAANEIILSGLLFSDIDVRATYNATEGTIEIAAQETAAKGSVEQGGPTYPIVVRFANDDKNVGKMVLRYTTETLSLKNNKGEIVQEYHGPGFITEDMGTTMVYTVDHIWNPAEPSGYAFLNYMMFQTFDGYCADLGKGLNGFFQFNSADWKLNPEKATFQDGWIFPAATDNVATWNVDVMESINNPGHILLVNPYQNAPDEYKSFNEDKTAEGYIYLDLSNRGCIIVRPFVYSGFTNTNPDQLGVGRFFNSNDAAFFYYNQHYTKDEIIVEYEDMEMDIPQMDDSNFVVIPDCKFTADVSMLYQLNWIDQNEQPIDMIANIQLPTLVGVEGIVDDSVEAPARFFNLQGVEVAAPVKGEVTIVKKGNKSYKQIAK